MDKFKSLMQREWMQHRKGWALLAGIPLVLALLLTSLGQISLDADTLEKAGDFFPTLLGFISIVATTAVLFGLMWVGSLIIVSGLPRRDNGDRSIEFWLSLPTSHSQSLAAPLLVHLVLAPAAALLVGLAGGYAMSLVLVTRLVSFGEWLALPWGHIIVGSLVFLARLLAGLPLATLWLAPLILLVMLLTAQFGRWGWVILTVGLGLGGLLLKQIFGQPLLSEVTAELLKHAGQALVHGPAQGQSLEARNGTEALAMMREIPAWAVGDFGASLRDAFSPLMAGALLFSAACFALLVKWRERGAGA